MATATRTVGRLLTGFGALVLLCALLVGAPVALVVLAGNPLPAQAPTLAEVGAVLTSRDDGQLFLRALALAGWAGWATFALSVLVELGALALRRPAPRLPGMRRQQRAAAVLLGSVALILAASPVAASAAAVTANPSALATAPAATTLALPHHLAGPDRPTPAARDGLTHPVLAAPRTYAAPMPASSGGSATAARVPPGQLANPADQTFRAESGGAGAGAQVDNPARRAPVYQVARGDHLGSIAERYLDSFGEYRTLAGLNQLADPDRIHPGQLLRLPAEAQDRGVRPHATGRLVARPTPQRPAQPAPATQRQAPPPPAAERPAPAKPHESAVDAAKDRLVVTVGAARPGDPDRVNRPLAVSAILAVSSIVGAQIGAVLGLRRRPAAGRAGAGRAGAGLGGAGRGATAARRELPAGRHRRD